MVVYSRAGPMLAMAFADNLLDMKHLLHVQVVVCMGVIAVKTKAPTSDPCGKGFSG